MEIPLIGKRIRVPKLVGDWLEFDQAFSAKVKAGDWKSMRKDEILYGSTQLVVAIAVAACGLVDRGPSKPPELPVVQPRIGLINESIAAGSPASLKKLSDVKSRSGISSCVPQLINVNSSKGAEELGICRVENNGVEGSVIVSRDTSGGTEIINKPLVGYRQSDGRIIVGYQRSDVPTDVGQVMVIYSDGSSEYVYANGLKVEFDAKETSGAELLVNLIGKLIEPGGVAAAADIDTPTPTATVTASAVPATPTKDAPTPVPATEAPIVWAPKTAAEYDQIVKDKGIDLVDWSGRVDGYAQIGWSTTNVLTGLDEDGSQIAGLKLLDYDLKATLENILYLVFGYKYAGKNNYILVKYNPCKPDGFYASPSRPTELVVGNTYVLALDSSRLVDQSTVKKTVGGDSMCQAYADLKPTTPNALKAKIVNNVGGLHDLTAETIVYGINK